MADLKNLKTLVIGGVSYNIGWSEHDFNSAYKAQLDGLSDSLASVKSEAIAAGVVSIAEEAGTGNILKTYKFTQNGQQIGAINLAKDLVVSGGEIVEKEGVKYLSLSIANQENPVEIPVTDLVDVYTGSAYINITDANVVEVKFADLATALVAEGNAVGDKMKANAEAAKAAHDAADAAQDTADGVRTDLGTKADEANAEGSAFARIAKVKADLAEAMGEGGSVVEQINSAISTYNTDTVQPIKSTADGAAQWIADNKGKLEGITAGANKVTPTYEEASHTLTITIE